LKAHNYSKAESKSPNGQNRWLLIAQRLFLKGKSSQI
jgi:hypothetical protein